MIRRESSGILAAQRARPHAQPNWPFATAIAAASRRATTVDQRALYRKPEHFIRPGAGGQYERAEASSALQGPSPP